MALGVWPEKLEFTLKKNESARSEVFLHNLDHATSPVQIAIRDPKIQDFVKISPSNPILHPQEIFPVEVVVKAKKEFTTHLEIIALPKADSELPVASGIRLPLKVKLVKEANSDFSIFLGFFSLLILAVFFWIVYQHRQKTPAL